VEEYREAIRWPVRRHGRAVGSLSEPLAGPTLEQPRLVLQDLA
jgi:hypothetical protein